MNGMSFTELLDMYDKLAKEGADVTVTMPSGDDLDSPERIARQKARGPRRGDLWYACDQGRHDYNGQYVLILDVDKERGFVAVIPLSNDTRAEMGETLTVEDTPLDLPLVAFPNLKAIIPTRLLYKPLKGLPDEVTDAVEKDTPIDGVRRGEGESTDDPFAETQEDVCVEMLKYHALCLH